MNITFYNSNAEKNRLNKIEYLKKIIEMDGTLRTSCSVSNPVINVELNPETVQMNILKRIFIVDDQDRYTTTNGSIKLIYDLISKIITANYVYIPDFNRYYFITDITSIRNNLWQITMRVDVLMSYYSEIKNLNAFVSRNEYTFDPLIKDDVISYYYDKDITESDLPKGDKVNTTFTTENHTRNFMLSCASFNTIPLAFTIDAPDESLPNINPLYYSDQFSTTSYILQSYEAEYVTYNALKHSDTVASYIKSLIAYPYELTPSTTDPTQYPLLFVGETQIKDLQDQDVNVPYSKYKMSQYLVIADFTLDAPENFLDYEPYTQYELYIPYCSWITIESNKILGKRIIVYYSVSYDSGSANVYVYNTTDNMILWSGSCQLGVQIGITATNNEQLTAQKQANNLNMILGVASSAISIGVGAYTGSANAVSRGVQGLGQTMVSYVNNNSMMFDKAQINLSSGNSGMYIQQDVRLRKTRLKPRGYDSDFASLYGKPLNQYKKISDLSGMTVIGECHLENFPSATDGELTEIDQILKSGILI